MKNLVALAAMLLAPQLIIAAPTDTLVGYWKMESAGGGVVVDSAGAGAAVDDGTWVGTAAYAPGPFGESLDLDGVSYLSIPHSEDTNKAAEDLSVSAWFQVAAWDTGWQCLLAKGEGSRYRIARRDSDPNEIAYSGSGIGITGGAVNDGQWHHIVGVTIVGTGTRLYIDGVRVSSAVSSGILDDTGSPLLIGANPESPQRRQWKGGIDDVGVFDEAFDDAQVAALYALATDPAYLYDLGTFNELLKQFSCGAGAASLLIGDHAWDHAASDPADGRDFFALSDDGSGLVATESAIHSFTATPRFLTAGQSSTLAWDVSGMSSLTLDDGSGPVVVTGQTSSTVTPAATTTYTLSGTAPQGTYTAELTVFVDTMPTVQLSADPANVVTGGGTILQWTSLGAETLSINQGIGDVLSSTDASGAGTTEVLGLSVSKTFTITVTNPLGTATDSVTVSVGALPVVNAFTISDDNPVPGSSVSVSWNVLGAATVDISPRIGTVNPTSGTASDLPLASTTYVLTASNPFGSVTAEVAADVVGLIGVDGDRWTVLHRTSTGTIENLEQADALLEGMNVADSALVTGVPVINFGPGADGEFPGDSAPPLGDALDDFAVQATANLIVNFSGDYTFGINNDEGGRLRIDGTDVIVDDALHAPFTSNGTVTLAAGTHTIDYVYFDRAGGEAGEVFYVGPEGTNVLLGFVEQATGLPSVDVVINEFMADNDDTLLDFEGDSRDWIELYNGTGSDIGLAGYYLTDDPALPNKYALPSHLLTSGSYLVVFASGKDTVFGGDEFHTNFALSDSGEYLGLYKDDGAGGLALVMEFSPTFPRQREDVSYGTWGNGQATGFMTNPTPGSLNQGGFLGFVGDTQFDVDRGLFTSAFDLTITADLPAATIRYTLNGSEPTANHGTIFTAPFTISKTTVVRAAAFLQGYEPTNIDTQTYIFTSDIPFQTQALALNLGFPGGSVNGQVYRYGMNGGAGSVPDSRIVQALRSTIPTISLVMDQKDFSSSSTGIFSNPRSRGRGWERPGSIELINEDGSGTGQLQINCGVRIRGGFSRSPNNPKHAFRLFFRGEYEGDLNYPMFQDEGASRFENLDLRTSQNYSWAFQNNSQNSFLREIHGRDAQREMGRPYTRSRYYHLYINGIYWGLYMSQERAENSYGETYFGGDKDEYDVIKSAGSSAGYTTEATDGSMNGAWRQLWTKVRRIKTAPTDNATYFGMQGLATDGINPHPNPASNPRLIEMDNLIDYILAIFYTGNYDAPLSTFVQASNNWYSMRNQNGPDGFRFFVHDGEHSLGTGGNSNNRVGPWGDQYGNRPPSAFERSNPQYMHEDLAWNAGYRIAFADRAHKHFFNGGAFTRTAANARLNQRFGEIRTAIYAELARWGGSFTYTTWTAARSDIVNFINAGSDGQTSGVGRDAYILNLLRNYNHGGAKPLYPPVDAPVYSVNGGAVPTGFQLGVTNSNGTGTVYYTIDGSDPRLVGGAVNPAAIIASSTVTLNQSGSVKARVLDGTTWSALNDFEFVVGVGGSSDNLVISEIHYNPDSTPGDTFADTNEYEFIELLNLSATDTIELTGVKFDGGIVFSFTGSNVTQLGPGARVVVANNLAAFVERYPSVPLDLIAGEYTGNLDNDGERVTLLGSDDAAIKDFVFGDSVPWPDAPDGDGYSMVLNCDSGNPDHGLAVNWRSHALIHGNPGGPDGTTWDDWVTDNVLSGLLDSDGDGDGSEEFFEYAFGTDPADPGSNAPIAVGLKGYLVDGIFGEYLTLTVQRNLDAGDLLFIPEYSTDLVTWSDAETGFVMESSMNQGDGTALVTWRAALPVVDPAKQQCYVRLRLLGK